MQAAAKGTTSLRSSSAVPCHATRPAASSTTSSTTRSHSPTSWLMTTAAAPASARRRTTACSWSRPSASRPFVGSSSTYAPGRMATTPASATRRRCPPERAKGERPQSTSSTPRLRRASRARASASSVVAPRLRGPKATSSSTVSQNSWFSARCWQRPTMPGRTGELPSRASPASVSSTPASTPASVDLPEPDRPATSSTRPGAAVTVTPSSAAAPS